jgi:DNA primase catalytic core
VPFFSDQFVDRVRSSSDIVDVIGGSLPLKRAGTNFVTLCPFHREKSPSFNVSPSKQIFHCFGCHKGGDVFRFVQDYENISFPEAVERLAERARIPLEYESGSSAAAEARSAKGRSAQTSRSHLSTLAAMSRQRGGRPNRPRVPRQTRRERGSHPRVPYRRRPGILG